MFAIKIDLVTSVRYYESVSWENIQSCYLLPKEQTSEKNSDICEDQDADMSKEECKYNTYNSCYILSLI